MPMHSSALNSFTEVQVFVALNPADVTDVQCRGVEVAVGNAASGPPHSSKSPDGTVSLRLEQLRPFKALDVARLLTILQRTCAHICGATWVAGKHSDSYELPATGGATEGRRPLSPEHLSPVT
jgi:hypothetical protein